jgi:hypothetical protein
VEAIEHQVPPSNGPGHVFQPVPDDLHSPKATTAIS